MYTAIQSRNIVKEKLNHRYTKLYHHYVNKIMRGIHFSVFIGKYYKRFFFTYISENIKVLTQIAEELQQYGYFCSVTKVRKKNSQKWQFYIDWSGEINCKINTENEEVSLNETIL